MYKRKSCIFLSLVIYKKHFCTENASYVFSIMKHNRLNDRGKKDSEFSLSKHNGSNWDWYKNQVYKLAVWEMLSLFIK